MTSASPISVAGIRITADADQRLEAVFGAAGGDRVDPEQQICDVAEACLALAQESLVESPLRLAGWAAPHPSDELIGAVAEVPPSSRPFLLGSLYERLMAGGDRRRSGTHLTPESIARQLMRCVPDDVFDRPRRVLDPAVGGAAFVIAAADRFVAHGASPADVLDGLFGVDLDHRVVAVAEAALGVWAAGHDLPLRRVTGLRADDGLLAQLPTVGLVVGNPPFLGQLRSSTAARAPRRSALRDRFPGLVGAYTDEASLFLAAGVDALADDGWLAMLQPVSLLAAQHAEATRSHVEQRGELFGLWLAREQAFEASVDVCGIVVRAGAAASAGVRRWTGLDFEEIEPSHTPHSSSWGGLAATALGAPAVALGHTRTLGELARTTAGFRDQFYGFAPHTSEAAIDESPSAPLVTVGMIDPFRVGWGAGSFRFAGRRFTRPVVDLESLTEADEQLAAWAAARRRPKLVVATQTRVIEAWVDQQGCAIPATPVISIEPHDPDDVWLVAAVVLAPAISAHCYARSFGTALSLDAMKLAARAFGELPLPGDARSWRRGADIAARLNAPIGHHVAPRQEALGEFGQLMTAAYGTSPDLVRWWLDRQPRSAHPRRPASSRRGTE